MEFAALTGSEKQIKWAEQIRRTQYGRAHAAVQNEMFLLIDYRKAHADAIDAIAKGEAKIAALNAGLTVLESQSSAPWWIDRRDDDARKVLAEAAQTTPEWMAWQAMPLA